VSDAELHVRDGKKEFLSKLFTNRSTGGVLMRLVVKIVIIAAFVLAVATARADVTLGAVKAKGFIQCGVSQGLPGFSNPDDQGNWTGLEVDFCRAMATAIFNDPDAVKFTPLSEKVQFAALNAGEVDVLARNTAWTMSRDSDLGEFIGVSYYDGQGFMVPKALGISSALKLRGANLCLIKGSANELNAVNYLDVNKVAFKTIAFEEADQVFTAYDSGQCDVYTTSRSSLAALRTRLSEPDKHIVLGQTISKDPLGPLVRDGDSQWGDIARWTLNCMINAEEAGLSSTNVEDMLSTDRLPIRYLLGIEGDLGTKIGLANDFCANIIGSIGNYGESFARNVGPETPLGLERGINALWSQGGILYAPPIR
jgi:general L-amino acid transport system substrate-binding protein